MRQVTLIPALGRLHPLVVSSGLIAVIGLIAAALLPLAFGPYLMFLLFFKPFARSAWPFDLWATSLVSVLAAFCAGWHCRFHLRLGMAVVAVGVVWSVLVAGLEWNPWTGSYAFPAINWLARDLTWSFAVGLFSASILFSVLDVRLEWPSPNSPSRTRGAFQFSLRSLMAMTLLLCLVLAIGRMAVEMHPNGFGLHRLSEIPELRPLALACLGALASTAAMLAVLADRIVLGLRIVIAIVLACIVTNVFWYALTGSTWLNIRQLWASQGPAWPLALSAATSSLVAAVLRRSGLRLKKSAFGPGFSADSIR